MRTPLRGIKVNRGGHEALVLSGDPQFYLELDFTNGERIHAARSMIKEARDFLDEVLLAMDATRDPEKKEE